MAVSGRTTRGNNIFTVMHWGNNQHSSCSFATCWRRLNTCGLVSSAATLNLDDYLKDKIDCLKVHSWNWISLLWTHHVSLSRHQPQLIRFLVWGSKREDLSASKASVVGTLTIMADIHQRGGRSVGLTGSTNWNTRCHQSRQPYEDCLWMSANGRYCNIWNMFNNLRS